MWSHQWTILPPKCPAPLPLTCCKIQQKSIIGCVNACNGVRFLWMSTQRFVHESSLEIHRKLWGSLSLKPVYQKAILRGYFARLYKAYTQSCFTAYNESLLMHNSVKSSDLITSNEGRDKDDSPQNKSAAHICLSSQVPSLYRSALLFIWYLQPKH